MDSYAHIDVPMESIQLWYIEQTFFAAWTYGGQYRTGTRSYDVSPEFERVIEEKIRETHYDMVFTVNYFPLISNVCLF